MMENNSQFIKKIYLFSLLPNIIAVLGGTINVFFDGVMVGRRLGEVMLESVNQCLPVYLLLCTLGSLFASGAAYLSSFAFGANDKKEGQRIFGVALSVSALAGIAFCAIGLIFAAPISRFLSVEETYPFVLTYLRITLAGGIFKVLLYIPFFYLRLEGKNKRSAAAMLTMTGLNIVLDYVFLYIFDMGIAGAAWASVIATIVACVMSFVFLFSDHSNFKLCPAWLKKGDFKKLSMLGSPMALNNILSAIRILLLNIILRNMGISGLLTVFVIINNINEFSICLQNGIPHTAVAITGIFYGEKDTHSLKKLLSTQLITGFVLTSVTAVLLTIFSGNISALFGSTANAGFAVVCFAISLIIGTANSIMAYYYNATGRIAMADMIMICRSCIPVVLFWLAASSSIGNHIWIFYPIAELVTSVIILATGFVLSHRKELSSFYLLDKSFELGSSISFSTDCSNEKICEASEKIHDFCEENEFTPKKTMVISLAIEEILTIIASKSLAGRGTMDVRVLKLGDEDIIRIRSGGKRYNPTEADDGEDDYMGVNMITRLAKKIEYQSTLGVNTLIIFI